jgi:hypothetical protein
MNPINKTYRVNRFAEVEGNNASGWAVINLVTGLQSGPLWRTYLEAKQAASFFKLYYEAVEQGR